MSLWATLAEARPLSEPLSKHLARHLAPRRVIGRSSDEELISETAVNLMRDALDANATDIHLDPTQDGVLIRLRIDGRIHKICLLPQPIGERLVGYFKVLAQIDPMPLIRPADGRTDYEVGDHPLDLRIAAAPCIPGDVVAIRILHPKAVRRQLQELGLTSDEQQLINNWLSDISGMFLVVGPTGSGKTTTLYSLLYELQARDRLIVTIEDPVEYRMDGVNQIQVDERRGLTFEEALKEVLRLDPDCLLIGEMRDRDSARAAIEASTNGKIVMSTMHSRDAVGAISAARNYDIEDHEIIAAVELVVAQRLVRVLCPNCRREEPPTEGERAWLRALDKPVPKNTWHPGGCPACRGIGYNGRTGIFQVWRLDEDSDRLISAHSNEHSLRRTLHEHGLPSLVDAGLRKVQAGCTSLAELQSLGGQARFIASQPGQAAAV